MSPRAVEEVKVVPPPVVQARVHAPIVIRPLTRTNVKQQHKASNVEDNVSRGYGYDARGAVKVQLLLVYAVVVHDVEHTLTCVSVAYECTSW